jgi:hypothetical protein
MTDLANKPYLITRFASYLIEVRNVIRSRSTDQNQTKRRVLQRAHQLELAFAPFNPRNAKNTVSELLKFLRDADTSGIEDCQIHGIRNDYVRLPDA